MSVDTVAHEAEVDPAEAQELLRTMAAIVRTVFGVALHARPDQPEQQPPAQVEAAPIAVSLPVEMPTLVSVPVMVPVPADPPAAITVELPVQQPEVALAAVPEDQPTAPIALPPIPMPSISLGDSSWTPPQEAPAPAYVTQEPADEPPVTGGHSLAMLHEIAFLDD